MEAKNDFLIVSFESLSLQLSGPLGGLNGKFSLPDEQTVTSH
jgi:hypothetical protein